MFLGRTPRGNAGGRLRVRYFSGNTAAKERISAPDDNPSNLPALPSRVELSTWQRKPSVVGESFRATLVSILFSGENGGRPRIMVVTSSNPGEGKSTVVSNLGIAVAEVNQRVLLIDADLRRPRLHDIFNLKNDSGLSDLLRSKETVSAALAGAIERVKLIACFL